MPRMNMSTRVRVIILRQKGYSVSQIRDRLLEEETPVSLVSIYKLLKKFERTGSVRDCKRKASTPKLLRPEHLRFIDDALAEDDELTARRLKVLLEERWPELRVSIPTIKRARKYDLGWIRTRPQYCQLVRVVNKQNRLAWCQERIDEKDNFKDVIWSDECSVQLDHHGRLCFRKVKQPRKLKPRPKHPPKVHIWAAISKRGATSVVIFKGIMTSSRYGSILETALLFIEAAYPDGHRFQQDNDPKHTSNYTKNFFLDKAINWWRTPAESPDLNPIENVWASLKYYLRHHYKPRNLQEVIDGIKKFWATMSPTVCRKYIDHLHKVMPKVVQLEGAASGY